MIKHYHSLLFNIKNNIDSLKKNRQESEILKLIGKTENFFDNSQSDQTKIALTPIISQLYAILSQLTSKECYIRTSNLYLLFKDVKINPANGLKIRLDSIKDELKNQNSSECQPQNKQTNAYLVKLIEDAL